MDSPAHKHRPLNIIQPVCLLLSHPQPQPPRAHDPTLCSFSPLPSPSHSLFYYCNANAFAEITLSAGKKHKFGKVSKWISRWTLCYGDWISSDDARKRTGPTHAHKHTHTISICINTHIHLQLTRAQNRQTQGLLLEVNLTST